MSDEREKPVAIDLFVEELLQDEDQDTCKSLKTYQDVYVFATKKIRTMRKKIQELTEKEIVQ